MISGNRTRIRSDFSLEFVINCRSNALWGEPKTLGLIKPGGTVVEGTAGNTGIGLAHVCRAKGYKCVIYMPNTQSQEKIDLLRMLGMFHHL